MANVDLPIPGSPPIKMMDPGTKPPPRTLFNSLLFMDILESLPLFISLSNVVVDELFLGLLEVLVYFSSTNEFQLLQDAHFPSHLADVNPHD